MEEPALRLCIVIYQSERNGREMLQILVHLFSNSGTEEDSLKVA